MITMPPTQPYDWLLSGATRHCLATGEPITLLVDGLFVTGLVTRLSEVDREAIGHPAPAEAGAAAAYSWKRWLSVFGEDEIDGVEGRSTRMEHLILRDVEVRVPAAGTMYSVPHLRLTLSSVHAWFVGELPAN